MPCPSLLHGVCGDRVLGLRRKSVWIDESACTFSRKLLEPHLRPSCRVSSWYYVAFPESFAMQPNASSPSVASIRSHRSGSLNCLRLVVSSCVYSSTCHAQLASVDRIASIRAVSAPVRELGATTQPSYVFRRCRARLYVLT